MSVCSARIPCYTLSSTRRGSLGIRGRLLSLTLGFAIPLAVTGLIGLGWLWTQSRRQLDVSVRQQAELAAAAFERWIEAERQPLVALAASASGRPNSQPLTEPELRSVLRAHPNWLSIEVRGRGGSVDLVYPERTTTLASDVFESLRSDFADGSSSAIEMNWSIGAGRPVLLIAAPLIDGGALDVQVDAASIGELVSDIELPTGSIISLFDPKRRIILRAPNGEHFIGRDMSDAPGFALIAHERSAVSEATSRNDGVSRVYGIARVGDTGCAASVGVPSARLYEPARAQFDRYLFFSLIALSCAVVAALVIARKVTVPVRLLGDAARSLGSGDFTVRARADGDSELSNLARVFNSMARSLEEREAKLAELDRLKSDFVSGVSHELRTPLTTIKTLTQVLQRGGETTEQRAKYLEAISMECDRQIDFVLDILDLSRIEAGGFDIALECVDVAQIVDAVIAVERFSCDAAGVALVADVETDLPYVLAEDAALRRVLRCLTENAIKFTPRGGTITVGAREVGGTVEIVVSDTGAGIPAADVPHLFDKFYQSDRGGDARRGVGLGLYLARTIVQHLGGKISVESEFGRGSVFSVVLRRWTAAAPSRVENQEELREQASADRR